MTTLKFKWTVSRGRNSYGYNICSLYVEGRKVSACNGGGYDMEGTALGNWVARRYADRLLALRAKDMPAQSHWQRAEDCYRCFSGTCRNKNRTFKWGEWGKDSMNCPVCGDEIQFDHNAGKRIDDGRYFYGLTFHDPDYDPGKAKIGKDCSDRTLGKNAEGKTVEQAEQDGESLG